MPSTLYTTLKLHGVLYTKVELLKLISERNIHTNWERYLYDFILEWISSSREIKVSTSGSTGVPKDIFVSKKAMINSALITGYALQLSKEDSAFLCLPCNYISGKMMVVRAFVLGLNLIVEAPNTKALACVKSVDFCAMTPMQTQISIHHIHKVKKLIIGGAEISTHLEKQLIDKSQGDIYHSYGMTETVSHIALRKLGTRRFVALPNVNLSQDERGCLVIEAPFLSDEKIATNDIVNLNKDGFLWQGRYDNIINSGGIKLFPEVIEKKLSSYIDRNFIIIAFKNELLGQQVVLLIEGAAMKINLDLLCARLDRYESPRDVYFLDSFVYTDSGKIDRRETIKLLSV